MRVNRRAVHWFSVCGLTILLIGCQSPNPAPAPEAAVPTVQTATALPHLVVTPTPTQPPAPTPLPPTPLPTADTRLITTFAPDVNPLTGEKAPDPAVLQRRPLAIKVANSNEPGVRPQSGVSFADLVYEHEAEGGVTRWTALFLSQSPALVGSNRSCRILDADLPAMYKALLACSGFSGGTREYYIKPTEFYAEHRVLSEEFGDSAVIFVRTDTAVPPHNLFVNPAAAWQEASRRGVNTPQNLSGMVFSAAPIGSGQAASQAIILYRGERAEWHYDPVATTCSSQAGCYLRWSDGTVHTDALNGQQLSAANVVIVYANHVEDARYLEDVAAGGHYSIQIQIWNDPGNPGVPGGRAQLLRDGQVFEGKWTRPGRFDMLTLVDSTGSPIPFKLGITWFQMVRLDTAVKLSP